MNAVKIGLIAVVLFSLLFFTGCVSSSSANQGKLRPKIIVPEEFKSVKNPIASNEASLIEGERLYKIYCDTCHGETGGADEGVTGNFEVQVATLADARVIERYTDGEHFYLIDKGVEGTKMRPFWELNDDEKWHIINYIKTLESKNTPIQRIMNLLP